MEIVCSWCLQNAIPNRNEDQRANITREHLTLFPKANHRSVEELILNRKFSSIEKTLEKHCKNTARVIINYSIFRRKIYQKDERVLFLKINISQNILHYLFTCRGKKVYRSKKKKNTFTPSIGSKIRKEKLRRIEKNPPCETSFDERSHDGKLNDANEWTNEWIKITHVSLWMRSKSDGFRFGSVVPCR